MPRVPLKQLKQRQKGNLEEDKDDQAEAADTMVGIVAKRINEAHQVRNKAPKRREELLGGDNEHDQSNCHDAAHDETDDEDNLGGAAVALGMPCEPQNQNIEPDNLLGKQRLNIGQEELDIMRRLEAKIQIKNRGKNLRLVVVEDDTENNTAKNEKVDQEVETPAIPRFAEESTGAEVKVQVVVHQAESHDLEANDCLGKANEPRRVDGEQKGKATRRQNREKMPQKAGEVRQQNTACVSWGDDESSESDGVWDYDEGDIPLLPRKQRYV